MSSGHQREAARRRRAHPKGSARTGEGARGGAVLLFPFGRHGRLRCGSGARREESEGEDRMKLGLREARPAGVFDAPSCALHRSIEMDGRERLGQRRSPGGIGREAEFPAQA